MVLCAVGSLAILACTVKSNNGGNTGGGSANVSTATGAGGSTVAGDMGGSRASGEVITTTTAGGETTTTSGGETTTTTTSGGAGGSGASACASCATFFTACAGDACPDESLCTHSAPLFATMTACLCKTCGDKCGANCGKEPPSADCKSCMLPAAGEACKTETDACVNDAEDADAK